MLYRSLKMKRINVIKRQLELALKCTLQHYPQHLTLTSPFWLQQIKNVDRKKQANIRVFTHRAERRHRLLDHSIITLLIGFFPYSECDVYLSAAARKTNLGISANRDLNVMYRSVELREPPGSSPLPLRDSSSRACIYTANEGILRLRLISALFPRGLSRVSVAYVSIPALLIHRACALSRHLRHLSEQKADLIV